MKRYYFTSVRLNRNLTLLRCHVCKSLVEGTQAGDHAIWHAGQGDDSMHIAGKPVRMPPGDQITFLVRYKNGAIGDFSSSRVATGRKNYFYYEIQGTEGTVVYNLERMCEVQVYFKEDADRDQGRDCGFRTVLLNPQHKGFKWFQPAGGIAIAFDDMKTLQAHALLQALDGADYLCNFELGAKVDAVTGAVLKSLQTSQWEKC